MLQIGVEVRASNLAAPFVEKCACEAAIPGNCRWSAWPLTLIDPLIVKVFEGRGAPDCTGIHGAAEMLRAC